MASVTLYFEAYPGDGVVSLRIEESADGSTGWTEIDSVVAPDIGTFPNWISSWTTDQATAIDRWFRIRWEVPAGSFTPYSEPVYGPDTPPRWTVPGLYRSWTRLSTVGLTDAQIQTLIDRAYFRLIEECGPYDETDPSFGERAQLAIHLFMDRLMLLSDPETQKVLAGYLEEQKGSYRYRRSDKAIDLLLSEQGIPTEVKSLICPFGIDQGGVTEMVTTRVFEQARWYLEDEGLKELVYTEEDRLFRPALAGVFYQPFQAKGLI